ncbi:MAG TPA: TetR/AcrR family transcriptional regulator [Acidimicrobiales bacterium]|nr:TetR/AcrR family transcriptional regulator [Acidimicrobiales bacterium]
MTTSTRHRLVESCSTMLTRQGFAGSGLKQIAKAGDATIGSLYHFFPGGKEELAAEALRASGAAYQALVESIFESAPDVVSGVRACFEGAADALEASDFADACPIATVALEVASSDERLRLVTAEVVAAWSTAATRHLERGGIGPDRAPVLATTLIAALEGAFLLSRVTRTATPMLAIGAVMADLVDRELAGGGTDPRGAPIR